jgi:HK97 family phage prohead protease
MEADFSGYATKAGLKCSDGRTITPEAFKHQDKMTVPLVWQHGHDDPNNVLGHMDLEARPDGIYGYGYFNDTPQGQNAKKIVAHKDVRFLSIFANGLVEKMMNGAKTVLHGAIREVSLVLAGANPGAQIDFVRIAHADGTIDESDDQAIITTGLELEHEDKPPAEPIAGVVLDDQKGDLEHAGTNMSAQEVYDSLTDVQKEVVDYMIGAALEEAGGTAAHSDLPEDAEPQQVYDALSDQQKTLVHSMLEAAKEEAKNQAIAEHSALNKEGNHMNVFESQSQGGASLRHAAMVEARSKLNPERIQAIMNGAEQLGSLKQSFLAHAAEYGIEDIDLLFPDAKMDGNGISIIARRMEWVNNVLTNTKHSPFSRIKSLAADLTADEARAKGYVKGNLKKDEVIKLLRRVTTPKTIYKKQKLDRDDIVDITDLDIVAWLKAEMRVMLDEELARAVLVSDGRDADDEDKIDEDHIRPVAYDDDMYATKIELDADFDSAAFIDAVVTAARFYKGTGTPTMYTTTATVTPLILAKDTLGRRLYNTMKDLAAALRVKEIVEVEAMEQDSDLVAVVVNLADYTIGADAGGNVAMFDDFDIDYNQQKYLIETRVSGALTKPKSALVFRRNSGRIVTPTIPTFDAATGVLTVPTQTGVVYLDADTGTTLAAGPQTAIAPGATFDVAASPANGYGFTHDADAEWAFTRETS